MAEIFILHLNRFKARGGSVIQKRVKDLSEVRNFSLLTEGLTSLDIKSC